MGEIDMDKENSKTLTAEQEMQLRKPIEDYVGEIQEKIDSLREDGSTRVVSLQNEIDSVKSLGLKWKKQKRWRQRIKEKSPN